MPITTGDGIPRGDTTCSVNGVLAKLSFNSTIKSFMIFNFQIQKREVKIWGVIAYHDFLKLDFGVVP